ncbi:MAG TPA: ABC transporter permease [Candidatus Tyrphobacter sp.]
MNAFATVLSVELMRRLRSRAFIVGLVFGSLGIALVTRLPALLASTAFGEMHQVAVAGPPALTVPAKMLLEKDGDLAVRIVPEPAGAPSAAMLRVWRVGSLLRISRAGDRLSVVVYAQDPSTIALSAIRGPLLPLDVSLSAHRPPLQLREALNFPVVVRSIARFQNAAQSEAAHGIAYLLLVLLYMLIVFNSQLVLTSVAEEKTSRIAELLVSSVDLTTLLAGKILASTALAVLQMAVWVLIGAVLSGGSGSSATSFGAASLSALPPSTAVGFVAFFVLGFLQMAVLFAGVGSLVNRTEDLGAVSGPLFLPVIVAFIIAIIALANPDAPYVVACSFVPILSPFVMFSRLAVSNVPGGQLLAAALIDVVSVVLLALIGGRLYRVGMLLYGRAPSWRQVARTIAGIHS